MPRPLNERGFEVEEEFSPYRMKYSIDNEGSEVVNISRNNQDNSVYIVTITVIDRKVMRVHGKTKQVHLLQDVKLDLIHEGMKGLEGVLSDMRDKDKEDDDSESHSGIRPLKDALWGYTQELNKGEIEIPDETEQLNYSQGLQIYRYVYSRLNVEDKIKSYVPGFRTPSEITLFNILGIETPEDLSKSGGQNASRP